MIVFRLQASEDGFDGHARRVGGTDPLCCSVRAGVVGTGNLGGWGGGVDRTGQLGWQAHEEGWRAMAAAGHLSCPRCVLSRVPAPGGLPPYAPVPPFTALSPAQVHTHVPRSSGRACPPGALSSLRTAEALGEPRVAGCGLEGRGPLASGGSGGESGAGPWLWGGERGGGRRGGPSRGLVSLAAAWALWCLLVRRGVCDDPSPL